MENDYGISKFAPLLAQNCPKKVTEVVRFLEDEMGVPDQYKLEDITVEDLTGNGLLKRGPAMQLVKGWQSIKVHGDKAQLGGTRNTYARDVDMSTGKRTYGDHTRVGGTHNDRTYNAGQGGVFNIDESSGKTYSGHAVHNQDDHSVRKTLGAGAALAEENAAGATGSFQSVGANAQFGQMVGANAKVGKANFQFGTGK